MIREKFRAAALAGSLALVAGPALARAQQTPAPAPAANDPIAAIDAAFTDGVVKLELQRLDALAKLASSQAPEAAAQTLLAYFRAALTGGHYTHAEPVAEKVIGDAKAHPELLYLANVSNILAEVDRGEFEQSLKSLAAAISAIKGDGGAVAAALPQATRLAVLEVYYQKLVGGGRYDIARKAFELIRGSSADDTVKAYCADRLNRLSLVGKPAPAIVGPDVDGKPFDLAKLQGKVVLVVFWASWCLPSGPEALRIGEFYQANAGKGFEIVGINLDTLQEGQEDPASVLTDVRRFLIQHNVRWPNLINGPGAQDFATAYGVSEVPSNVLIGRDGKVVHLDQTAVVLERSIQAELARPAR